MSYVAIGEVTKAWEEGLKLGRQRRAIPADVRAYWHARGRQLEAMLEGGHELGSELRPIGHDQGALDLYPEANAKR